MRALTALLLLTGCAGTFIVRKGSEEIPLRTGMRREDVEKILGQPKREWSADPNAYARRMLYDAGGGNEYVVRYTDERVDTVRPAVKVYDHTPPSKCREVSPVRAEATGSGFQYATDEARLRLEDAAFAEGANGLWLQQSNSTDPYSSAFVTVKVAGVAYACP